MPAPFPTITPARWVLLVMLGSLISVACGHTPAPPPPPCEGAPPLTLRFESAARLNLGEKGEPLAATLRIFALKADTKFLEATFDDLLDRPAETLGDALLATDEFAIFPKSTATRTMPRPPDAVFVAVVALFREPSGTFWRALQKLPNLDPDHCRKPSPVPYVVQLEDNRIELR